MNVRPTPQRTLTVDRLEVQVYADRASMGAAAAHDVAAEMRGLLASQERVRMIYAAAPSQDEFLAGLVAAEGLDWARVEAFHMDEYIGLPPGAPQRFGTFLRARLFDLVRPGRVEYIDGNAPDPDAECRRYERLLAERPIDIVCAGIGENGHLAFNDPPVADFDDRRWMKVVTLDEVCRTQQVHDGAFGRLEEVPTRALTLTIPALMAGHRVACIVPGPTKTEAVRATLCGPVATACPATILRRHPRATLYLDTEAAGRIS